MILFGICTLSFFAEVIFNTILSLVGTSYGIVLVVKGVPTKKIGKHHKFSDEYVRTQQSSSKIESNIGIRHLNFGDFIWGALFLCGGIFTLITSWGFSDVTNIWVLLDQIGMLLCYLMVTLGVFRLCLEPLQSASYHPSLTSLTSIQKILFLLKENRQNREKNVTLRKCCKFYTRALLGSLVGSLIFLWTIF